MPLCIAQIEGCDLQHRQHSVYFKASKYYSDTLECKNVMLFSVTKRTSMTRLVECNQLLEGHSASSSNNFLQLKKKQPHKRMLKQ